MSTASTALATTGSLAGAVGIGAALYAVFGPRRDAQKAGGITVLAVTIAFGANLTSSLLQGSGVQVAGNTGTTGTGRLPPVPAGVPV